jgi:hypothetical protein
MTLTGHIPEISSSLLFLQAKTEAIFHGFSGED